MTAKNATRPAGGTARAAAQAGDELKHHDPTAPDAPSASAALPRLRPNTHRQLASFGLQGHATLHDPDGRIFVRICDHFWAVIDWPVFYLQPYEEPR